MCPVCGIAGLYSPAGMPNPERVDAMRAALVHRGPDEGSTDVFGHCVLGHQRLKVIDLETGYQPVSNESGDVVAVFNGEAYNFRALRNELRAHDVRGTGDTPVLPHLYEESGPNFASRLDGMFALALWDAGRERLVLARDRLGKKPLLWTRLPDGTLAFASELKALLRLPDVRREVELDAIDAYLALQYVPDDRTGLSGIRKLPPGHVLVAEGEGERIEPYWQLEPAEPSTHEDDWLERVRSTVGDAVRKRLVADVPLGALLSGGLDSSIVVALIRPMRDAWAITRFSSSLRASRLRKSSSRRGWCSFCPATWMAPSANQTGPRPASPWRTSCSTPRNGSIEPTPSFTIPGTCDNCRAIQSLWPRAFRRRQPGWARPPCAPSPAPDASRVRRSIAPRACSTLRQSSRATVTRG